MNGEKQKAEIGKAEIGNESPCLTRFELAALLNVSVRTVDRMIAAEQLPVRRVRGHVRFLRSDVEQYLSRSSNSTPHPDPLPDRGGEGTDNQPINPAL